MFLSTLVFIRRTQLYQFGAFVIFTNGYRGNEVVAGGRRVISRPTSCATQSHITPFPACSSLSSPQILHVCGRMVVTAFYKKSSTQWLHLKCPRLIGIPPLPARLPVLPSQRLSPLTGLSTSQPATMSASYQRGEGAGERENSRLIQTCWICSSLLILPHLCNLNDTKP